MMILISDAVFRSVTRDNVTVTDAEGCVFLDSAGLDTAAKALAAARNAGLDPTTVVASANTVGTAIQIVHAYLEVLQEGTTDICDLDHEALRVAAQIYTDAIEADWNNQVIRNTAFGCAFITVRAYLDKITTAY